jgi:serine protease
MRRLWAVLLILFAIVIAGGLVMRAQTQAPFQFLNVGLPAANEDTIQDQTHRPASPEAILRAAMHAPDDLARTGRGGRAFTAGRVILKFQDGISEATRDTVVRAVVASGVRQPRDASADFEIVTIDPREDGEAVAGAFRARPEIEYAQAAYRVHTTFVPNDPHYADLQWNLPLINLESAWDIQPQAGSAITVAVVDTGLAYLTGTLDVNIQGFTVTDPSGLQPPLHYPALGRQLIPYAAADQIVGGGHASRIVAPRNFITTSAPPLDFDGHGTHVSGTIGQLTNDGIGTAGVAFNVKLMPVKVIASDWDLLFGLAPFVGGTDDTVALGVRWAADNGANIINMSLGSSGPSNCATKPNQDGCAPVIESAIRYAVGKGCFVVISAGNEAEVNDPDFGLNPTSVLAEIASRIPGAVSVAAVDRRAVGQTGTRRCTGEATLPDCHAYYSSFGPYVELSAPGGSERGFGRDGYIWQQTFDYTFTDTFLLDPSQYGPPRFDVLAYVGYIGTSMSAPHVSGVAAMLMQQGIKDPVAIEAALEKFAIDLGAPGRDNMYGFGLVDARAVLRGLGLAR